MAYEEFAYYYDFLNGNADYDALFCAVKNELKRFGIDSGIVADLGCGTGELTIMLAKSGYDMIAVDISEDMLCVAREKMYESEISGILFLRQDLTQLDLYGTIRGAVCTFDTLNHVGDIEKLKSAICKVSLFLEKGSPFVFDMNTPYKHKNILANNTFTIEDEEVLCTWENEYCESEKCTKIKLKGTEQGEIIFDESFSEHFFTKEDIINVCEECGLSVEKIIDGENFTQLSEESERFFVTAVKK